MLLKNKFFKKIFFPALAFVWLASASLVFAQDKPSLYQNSLPKDTDFDGLTDQGEVRLFLPIRRCLIRTATVIWTALKC